MAPGLAKFALTAHIAASVGWLGAVACFLALAVTGLTSQDVHVVRAAYVMMRPTGWFVLVPLSFASLVTGLVQGLGTRWGVFRHYWVVFKLAINIASTVVLLSYMQTLGYVAAAAADAKSSLADLRALGASPAIHATAALLLLIVATTLSVYKPRGLTRHGWRKAREQRAS